MHIFEFTVNCFSGYTCTCCKVGSGAHAGKRGWENVRGGCVHIYRWQICGTTFAWKDRLTKEQYNYCDRQTRAQPMKLTGYNAVWRSLRWCNNKRKRLDRCLKSGAFSFALNNYFTYNAHRIVLAHCAYLGSTNERTTEQCRLFCTCMEKFVCRCSWVLYVAFLQVTTQVTQLVTAHNYKFNNTLLMNATFCVQRRPIPFPETTLTKMQRALHTTVYCMYRRVYVVIPLRSWWNKISSTLLILSDQKHVNPSSWSTSTQLLRGKASPRKPTTLF